MIARSLCLIFNLAILLLCMGCQEAGPTTYPVSGKVSWNNAPLPEGVISFEPINGSTAPGGGKIVGGAYSIRAGAGKCRVRILATRPKPEVDKTMGMAPVEQYLPAKYNSESTLEFEVRPTNDNRQDFELVP